MGEICGDDRFELIDKAKKKLLEDTNIESRPEEIAVLDSVLFRCWQMGWLDRLREGSTEQAIAATLGGGECELHECEGSFSAVNRPVWRCDCGAFMTQYTDATTYHKPRYCPNCGRKAVKQ